MSIHGGDIYRNKVDIDFSVNISPYGIPPMVRAKVTEAVNEISSYPDPLYEALRNSIGASENLNPDNIICGNGSSELIFAVTKAISNIKGTDINAGILVPCFSEYEGAIGAAGINNINKVYLSENRGFTPKEDDISGLAKDASIIILGNPNNPTGKLLNKTWLIKLLNEAEKSGLYVILDETFLPLTECLSEYDDLKSKNLIRIRAYTKSMAIPGVRLGYLYSDNSEIITEINRILPDWNVSIIAEMAGIACTEAKQWLCEKVNDPVTGLKALRDGLRENLLRLGTEVFDSDTNFLLVKSDRDLYAELLRKGVLIRDCSSYEGLNKGYFRIAVKSESDNKILIGRLNSQNINEPEFKTKELLSVKPAEIEKTSFDILTGELLAKGINLTGDTAPIIKRCIHTTADFQYATTLTFSDNAVEKIKKLIREGATIVTDTNMALSGINKTELSKYGCDTYCFMADPQIAKVAKERGCTRATASMEHAATLGKKIIFAVGNAPTALVTLCEMMDKDVFKPDFVIGVPVGFVNVEQAKEMVIERDIDYIVNRGRKGGSNVAAAIVNAVLYSMRDE